MFTASKKIKQGKKIIYINGNANNKLDKSQLIKKIKVNRVKYILALQFSFCFYVTVDLTNKSVDPTANPSISHLVSQAVYVPPNSFQGQLQKLLRLDVHLTA